MYLFHLMTSLNFADEFWEFPQGPSSARTAPGPTGLCAQKALASSEDTRSASSGSRGVWVRVLSGLKKESAAETHNCRQPHLVGNSPLIYLISHEIGKCVATKQRFFIFLQFPFWEEGEESTGDSMVFSLVPGSSLMVWVAG